MIYVSNWRERKATVFSVRAQPKVVIRSWFNKQRSGPSAGSLKRVRDDSNFESFGSRTKLALKHMDRFVS